MFVLLLRVEMGNMHLKIVQMIQFCLKKDKKIKKTKISFSIDREEIRKRLEEICFKKVHTFSKIFNFFKKICSIRH